MSESAPVDDIWSFERVAQMRRMHDVQPAVLSQFKALGPKDLLPVQFQFSHRRTNLINSATEPTNDDEDEEDYLAGDEELVQQSSGSNKNWRQISKQPPPSNKPETDLEQRRPPKGKESKLVHSSANYDDQRSLESSMSNVSLDGLQHSAVRGRNMRAAPRSRSPTSVHSSRVASRVESPDRSADSALDDGSNPDAVTVREWKKEQQLLSRLYLQRLETQEKLLADLQRSFDRPGSSSSGGLPRYSDADSRGFERRRRSSHDKLASNSGQSVDQRKRRSRRGSVDSAPSISESDSRHGAPSESRRKHRADARTSNPVGKL